jgi:hypothetical protein
VRRALLLLNPRSRHGSTSGANAAIRHLRENGLSLLEYSNHDPSDVASLIRSHAPEIDGVVVAGGDGVDSFGAPTSIAEHGPRHYLISINSGERASITFS